MSFQSNIQNLLKTSFSDHLYLRSSNLAQLDRDLSRESLNNKPAILHYNLQEVTINQGVSNLEETHPIQIFFCFTAAEDEDAEELDNILDACKTVADKFWDLLLQDINFQKIVQTKQGDDVYTLIPRHIELGGEALAGYELNADIKIHRSTQTIAS